MNSMLTVTPAVEELAELCRHNSTIDTALYQQYDVKRGLRDVNGHGVLAGLTNISEIISRKVVDGQEESCPGELYYRGYNVNDLVRGFSREGRMGFEETAFLLLFGELPDRDALAYFEKLLATSRTLPTNFVRDVVMKASTHDLMNTLSRSVLTLASYDERCDDISLPNVLRQCLMLIAVFPMLAVYSYHAYNHYECFTTHVVTSSGTDTYSAMAAALGSLKGPKHGGANIKVVQMFQDLKQNVADTTDEQEVEAYLRRLLHKEAFDRKGLIYGMGHAVYSLSDPRAALFKGFVSDLAHEKHRDADFALYTMVERLAAKVITEERRIYKGVSANVDFYSGLLYSMLGLPLELYTPIFATARIVGWSAHRLEELINVDKIIRPAYVAVPSRHTYVPLDGR